MDDDDDFDFEAASLPEKVAWWVCAAAILAFVVACVGLGLRGLPHV